MELSRRQLWWRVWLSTRCVHTFSEKLIVSLELPENARDLDGAFWHQARDGRSSWAMWNLVRQLLQHQTAGHLEIQWQDGRNEFPNGDRDRFIGECLLESSKRGLLIALSGNLHSSKAPMPFAPETQPAGCMLGLVQYTSS